MTDGYPKRFRLARRARRTIAGLLGVIVLVMGLSSCATVGREFPESEVSKIRIGQTTQEQVREMFGSPWRTGLEDGHPTWTYGKYRYRLFGQASTKDLVIRFDDNGVVTSYTFNTTEHEE